MSIQTSVDLDLLLAPPLEQPLRLRMGKGYFGARRGGGVRPHKGVDLLAPIGTNVYAVNYGVVVDAVKRPPEAGLRSKGGPKATANGRIHIDHHGWGDPPSDPAHRSWGYLSRYNHLKDVKVQVGDKVDPGTLLGSVGNPSLDNDNPWPDHLHLDLRVIAHRDHPNEFTNPAIGTELDPTRALYAWERHQRGTLFHPQWLPAHPIQSLAHVNEGGIDMLEVRWSGSSVWLPLYRPDATELSMAESLRHALLQQLQVELEVIDSVFFGERKVITGVRLTR